MIPGPSHTLALAAPRGAAGSCPPCSCPNTRNSFPNALIPPSPAVLPTPESYPGKGKSSPDPPILFATPVPVQSHPVQSGTSLAPPSALLGNSLSFSPTPRHRPASGLRTGTARSQWDAAQNRSPHLLAQSPQPTFPCSTRTTRQVPSSGIQPCAHPVPPQTQSSGTRLASATCWP